MQDFSNIFYSLQVANEIRKAGGQAIAVGGDVTAMDFPDKCVKATIDAFGQIDILVNNAGECAPGEGTRNIKTSLGHINGKWMHATRSSVGSMTS